MLRSAVAGAWLDRAAGVAVALTLAWLAFAAALLAASMALVPAYGDWFAVHGYAVLFYLPEVKVTLIGVGAEAFQGLFLAAAALTLLTLAAEFHRARPALRTVLEDPWAGVLSTPRIVLAALAVTHVYWRGLALFGGCPPAVCPAGPLDVPGNLFAPFIAPVTEEVVYRGVLIGVPLAALSFAREGVLPWRSWLLGGFARDRAAVALLLLAATLFGYAHLPGGGPVRVPPAVAVGLLAGLAYLRSGLPAAVLVHFASNGVVLPEVLDPVWGLGGTLATAGAALAALLVAAAAPAAVRRLSRGLPAARRLLRLGAKAL